jgi:hypothetical protein
MKYAFLYRHSGNRMAIVRNPALSRVYWIPDNSFAVSGMTLRIKWDSNGSVFLLHSSLLSLW